MEEEATLHLPVTVDKSHIITLGERLYRESIELVRELVNNAYDADATRVNVQIDKDKIVVEGNGNGMDLALLSHPDNPHLVYQRQSKLMRDAFGEEESLPF